MNERISNESTATRRACGRSRVLAAVVGCFFCSVLAAPAQRPDWEFPSAKLQGWHAQALVLAMQEFRKNQGELTAEGEPVYGDLRHYTVEVIDKGREVEIVFAPEQGPKDRKQVTVGGRTQYGIIVSYLFSRKLKLIKTSFAR